MTNPLIHTRCSMRDVCFLTATALREAVVAGRVSAVDVVSAYLERIAERNTQHNAYVTVLAEEAMERARAVDRELDHGAAPGVLHGVPVAVKDLFAMKAGVPHSFGSAAFADYVPSVDSIVVERLEAAGAIVVGKTNIPAFGNRGVTDNAVLGATTSPVAGDRVAGGTSGGSAAAVADRLAPLAQGSDAGGSIRIPAACCHVFGMKPSFGRVPNGPGAVAFGAHTPFTQHGPLARSVEDAARFLDAVTGEDARDPFSHGSRPRFRDVIPRGVDGLSVAVSPGLGLFAVDPAVRGVVDEAVAALADCGADVARVDPAYAVDGDAVRSAWRTLFQTFIAGGAHAVADVTGIDPVAVEDDEMFQRVVAAGEARSAMELKRADRVRAAVFEAIERVFAEYDLVVSATLAVPPFPVEAGPPVEIDGVATDPHLDWMLTWPFNMTPHPAASVPAGLSDGLPVGLQVVGRKWRDADVLAASATLERVRPWDAAYPWR